LRFSQKTSVSLSKSPGLNRIGEAPGTLIILQLLSAALLSKRPALCKNGHFFFAAGSFDANEWPMDLARQSVLLPVNLTQAALVERDFVERPAAAASRRQSYSVIGAGCFWSALHLNQIS